MAEPDEPGNAQAASSSRDEAAAVVEAAYAAAVRELVADSLRSDRAPSFTALVREARGATPDLVYDALRALGRPYLAQGLVCSEPFRTRPELHPLLYEWYFTQATANQLARTVSADGPRVACIGTPTVASLMADRARETLLLDADPDVFRRFPTLRRLGNVSITEVGRALPGRELADSAILDPPWYVHDVLRWLAISARYVRPQGSLYCVLFPELTRPTAQNERAVILEHASRLGSVELLPRVLDYSTPRFELESLAVRGCPHPGDWRIADLLIITGLDPRSVWAPAPAPATDPFQWDTFLLGDQVVKLRPQTAPGGYRLRAVPGCISNTLPSVSRRDARRAHVDFWTSRNRVAQVGDYNVVADWLEQLQNGLDLRDLAESTQPPCQDELWLLRDLVGAR